MTIYITLIVAALLGFIASEAIAIIPAIKDDDTSPSTFSFRYYFSRPKNQLLLLLNACGSGILFLGRHEVLAISSKIPFVSDYLGGGTPVLMCGMIGLGGGRLVRYVIKKLSAE